MVLQVHVNTENKDKPVAKSVSIDLRTGWGQSEMRKVVKELKAKIALFAPPCGSAARCRDWI